MLMTIEKEECQTPTKNMYYHKISHGTHINHYNS